MSDRIAEIERNARIAEEAFRQLRPDGEASIFKDIHYLLDRVRELEEYKRKNEERKWHHA